MQAATVSSGAYLHAGKSCTKACWYCKPLRHKTRTAEEGTGPGSSARGRKQQQTQQTQQTLQTQQTQQTQLCLACQEEVEAKKKEQEAAATVEASKQEAESNPSPDATSTGPDEAAAAEQQAKQGPEVPKYEIPDLSGLKAAEKARSAKAAEEMAPAAASETPGMAAHM